MTNPANLTREGRTLTVRVHLALQKRGGRKLVITPEGTAWAPARTRANSAMVKAFARAYRWKRMLESGECPSVKELAAAERINQSYVCRILRLTLLAPDIIESILHNHNPLTTLPSLLRPFPLNWELQREWFSQRLLR